MSDIPGSYVISDAGKAAGRLEVSREGLFYRFHAVCPDCGEGPARLILSSADREAPVGLLCPENGALRLERRYSRDSLRAMGIHGIDSCRLERSRYAWRAEARPDALFADRELKKIFAGVGEALSARDGGQLLLAVPSESGRPFGAMPLFCLGEAADIGGKAYVVFRFRGEIPAVIGYQVNKE